MDNIRIHDEHEITGSYVLLPLDHVSYYPVEKVIRRIALSIYNVDLQTGGLFSSDKYNQEGETNHVDVSRPLGFGTVDGDFYLFLPKEKPAWGLLDIRNVVSRRPDVNLSLVSPMALMPHRLHVIGGGTYENHRPHFSVVDKDGSRWTLHCKFTPVQLGYAKKSKVNETA